MGLGRILDRKASVIPTEQITFRIDVDMLAYADEIAAELEVPRAEVLREAVRDGMRQLYGDWQQALENGAKKQPKKEGKK